MIYKILWYLRSPGVVVHELAHLFAVWLTPNVKVTNVDITSEVEHEGYYTVARAMIISYVPLFFNTGLALILYHISQNYLTSFSGSINLMLTIILICLGYIISLSAIPSYQDASTPIHIMREQIFTRRFLIILILSPIYLVISLPTLVLSYISESSYWLNILSSVIYATFVYLIYFGYIDFNVVIAYLNSIIEYIITLI